MNLIILILLLISIAGISKACADTISDHLSFSIFEGHSFFDKSISWKNKWTNDNTSPAPYRHWYYLGFKTEYKERFPLSSTMLVFITDGWHLFNFITYTCYELVITRIVFGGESHYNYYWSFCICFILILKTIRGLGFWLFYNKILIKK